MVHRDLSAVGLLGGVHLASRFHKKLDRFYSCTRNPQAFVLNALVTPSMPFFSVAASSLPFVQDKGGGHSSNSDLKMILLIIKILFCV